MKEKPEKPEVQLVGEELRAIARELHDLNANIRLLIHILKKIPVAIRFADVGIELAEGRSSQE